MQEVYFAGGRGILWKRLYFAEKLCKKLLQSAERKENNGNTGENTESTTSQTSSQAGNNTENGPEEYTPAESIEPAQESSLMYLRDAVAEALGEDYWPDSVMEPEYVQAKKDRVEDVEKVLGNYREQNEKALEAIRKALEENAANGNAGRDSAGGGRTR